MCFSPLFLNKIPILFVLDFYSSHCCYTWHNIHSNENSRAQTKQRLLLLAFSVLHEKIIVTVASLTLYVVLMYRLKLEFCLMILVNSYVVSKTFLLLRYKAFSKLSLWYTEIEPQMAVDAPSLSLPTEPWPNSIGVEISLKCLLYILWHPANLMG